MEFGNVAALPEEMQRRQQPQADRLREELPHRRLLPAALEQLRQRRLRQAELQAGAAALDAADAAEAEAHSSLRNTKRNEPLTRRRKTTRRQTVCHRACPAS